MISDSTGSVSWNYSGRFSEHTFEAVPAAVLPDDATRESFVSSWENTVSIIGVIIIVSLTGSALMIFRSKKSITDVMNDLPGIPLVVVLVVLGYYPWKFLN